MKRGERRNSFGEDTLFLIEPSGIFVGKTYSFNRIKWQTLARPKKIKEEIYEYIV